MHSPITLQLKDKAHLQAAYMAFIAHGGLFIATPENFALHQLLTINLQLWSEPTITFVGKVVWLTPQQAPGAQAAGAGIQLPANAQDLKKKIEYLLMDNPYDC